MRKIGDKVTANGGDCIFEIASVFRGEDGERAYKLIYEDSTEVYGIVSDEDVEDYTPPDKFTFTVKVRERENLVEVFMADTNGQVIERAHGHIKTNGITGITQALNFATFRLHKNLGGANN